MKGPKFRCKPCILYDKTNISKGMGTLAWLGLESHYVSSINIPLLQLLFEIEDKSYPRTEISKTLDKVLVSTSFAQYQPVSVLTTTIFFTINKSWVLR